MNYLFTFIISVCLTFSVFNQANAQQSSIKGSVTDASSGETLPGVSVLIKGTNQGTQTDVKGEFNLKAPGNATLVFSYVGYISKEVTVNNQTTLNVQLEVSTKELEQVVVVGYGTTTVKDLTAPIATVKSSELTKQPVSNVAQALQGKVAGVIVSNSGRPGSSPTMMIRGLGTVRGGVGPLFVVDDVFMDDIGFLSSSDIETMTILKDASSSAIYGVRAANGVVIITTKKGKINRPMQASFNAYTGFQRATNLLPMADRDAYISLTNEKMYAAYLRNMDQNSYQPLDPSKFTGNTNWMDQVLRGSAWMQNYDISINGGNEKSTYYFGLGYFQQDGLLKKNDYQRITLRGAQDLNLSKFVKTGYNITVSGWDQNSPAAVFGQAYITPPAFTPKDANGNFNDPILMGLGNFANPSATLEYFNEESKNIRGLMNIYLDIKPISNLTFRTSFTPDIRTTYLKNYTPKFYVSSTQRDTIGHLRKENNFNINYVWDNTATYEKRFGNHSIKGMIGLSATHYSGELLRVTGENPREYGASTQYLDLGNQTGFRVENNPYDKVNALSYYGRLNYSFKDRYLMTATLRRDGSSKFPKADRWATLPSLGLGWIMTAEDFMRNAKWLDYLKLRASWGMLGNDNIPQNAYTSTITTDAMYSAIFGQYGSTVVEQGYNDLGSAPERLKWETTSEFDFGLDANLLGSRLNIVADYYRRVTKDAIFQLSVPATDGAGGSTRFGNNAEVLNRGFEFSAGWSDKLTNDLLYNIGGNITTIHNEILSLPPGVAPVWSGNAYNGYQATYTQTGRPIGEFYVLEVGGIFQNWDDVHNYVNKEGRMIMPNAVPGDFKYVDRNNDGIIDNLDRMGVGNYVPKVVYGFNLGLNYKNFDISADFQGVGGNKIYNLRRINRFSNENYDVDFYNNSWHGEGTSNVYPSADVAGGLNNYPNTFFVESGSYFRIRNVQLGYTLPNELIKKAGINKLRVYVTAQNLATFFGYNGYTPEIPNGTDINSTNMGMDEGIYPLSRTLNFGINVNF